MFTELKVFEIREVILDQAFIKFRHMICHNFSKQTNRLIKHFKHLIMKG